MQKTELRRASFMCGPPRDSRTSSAMGSTAGISYRARSTLTELINNDLRTLGISWDEVQRQRRMGKAGEPKTNFTNKYFFNSAAALRHIMA